jgi:hypothetical protein
MIGADKLTAVARRDPVSLNPQKPASLAPAVPRWPVNNRPSVIGTFAFVLVHSEPLKAGGRDRSTNMKRLRDLRNSSGCVGPRSANS